MTKRFFDLAVATIALVLLSPFFLLMAILIPLDSPGPVFYRASLVGKDGKIFAMLKFRTMVTGADRIGPTVTCGRDPRITRVGRAIRPVRLDELPQFLNVIKGEMSLVGPRPETEPWIAHYTPDQQRVLSVRPGMTSWASIRYRFEEEGLSQEGLEQEYSRMLLPEKLALDLRYVEQQSLGLDIAILFQTAWALFTDPIRSLLWHSKPEATKAAPSGAEHNPFTESK
jgi:lipopolysaccharide/colanic/teichoic acid biosynthesis glycosyltransferase